MSNITRYQTEKTDRGLLIKGVIMAVIGKVSERDIELTTPMFKKMVSYFYKRKDRGNTGSYVLLDHDGPRVGQITELRTDGTYLIGDLLIENEDVAARVTQDGLSDISITFFPKEGILADLSLLDNAFGQLSEVIPPLLVDVQREFGFSADTLIECRYNQGKGAADTNSIKTAQTKELTMPDLTPEQLNKMIADAVKTALETKAADTDPVNEDKVKEALAEIAAEKISMKVDGFVSNLALKGYGNKEHLRKSFEKFGDNIQAMEVEYKRLMEKANDDIKLEMERTYEAPKLEDLLRKEHEAYKATYKSNMDFHTFCTVVKGEGKADLGNKHINYIEGSIKL